jgi:outer membrane protein, multidrug efflux system
VQSLWSVGAGAMLPLFEGGLRRAELQCSWSQYAQTRDNYRATVLAAFQEVEDGLSLTKADAAVRAPRLRSVRKGVNYPGTSEADPAILWPSDR